MQAEALLVIFLDFITCTKLGEEYKSLSSSLRNLIVIIIIIIIIIKLEK